MIGQSHNPNYQNSVRNSFEGPKQMYGSVCVLKFLRSGGKYLVNLHYISNIYNMSGRVVSDIQTRAEGESLYI